MKALAGWLLVSCGVCAGQSASHAAVTALPVAAARPIAAASSGCASTIAAAVGAGSDSAVLDDQTPASGGYRVVQDRWDALLGVHWAMVEMCAHPERPWRAVAMKMPVPVDGRNAIVDGRNAIVDTARVANSRTVTAMQPILVRAGQMVNLWQKDDNLRLMLRAQAEQNGHAGETIWLRLRVISESAEAGESNTGNWQRRQGIVRDTGSVEMVR